MKIIKAEECSSIKMTTGNEKKFTKIIHHGVVKEWVGIGWITTDEKPDPDKYPTVKD